VGTDFKICTSAPGRPLILRLVEFLLVCFKFLAKHLSARLASPLFCLKSPWTECLNHWCWMFSTQSLTVADDRIDFTLHILQIR